MCRFFPPLSPEHSSDFDNKIPQASGGRLLMKGGLQGPLTPEWNTKLKCSKHEGGHF